MGQCRRRLARKAAGPREEVNNARSKGCLQHSRTMGTTGTTPGLPEDTQISGEQIICIVLYDFMP